jgi:hypothetical protein
MRMQDAHARQCLPGRSPPAFLSAWTTRYKAQLAEFMRICNASHDSRHPANATEKRELTVDGRYPTASQHSSGPSRALVFRHFVCVLSTARHVQLKVSTIDSASGRRVADLTYCPSTTRSIRNASDEPRTGLKSAALVE